LKWLGNVAKAPLLALRLLWKRGWSKRTIIVLVMQTLDNSLRLRPLKIGRKTLLQTDQDPDNPNPTYIPVANRAARLLAEKIDAIPQSNLPEALLNTPATAHILGGAVIAGDPSNGVVDARQRVFGYQNLLVCDGSVVPANPGVNPSLTIAALAEHAMTHVPPRARAEPLPATGGALDGGDRADEGVEAKERPAGEPAQHETAEPAEPVVRHEGDRQPVPEEDAESRPPGQ
jgi:cholesterol oxidase